MALALLAAPAAARPPEPEPEPEPAPAALAPEATAAPASRPQAEAAAAPFSASPGPICDLIEAAAARHGLPPSFFARLIWKESRFDIAAISPMGALGVAQFMPGTARLEGLADPFDPVQAIPASAKHLSDLRAEFGNLGLAAAAYNAGRARVARWLAGRSGLPWETLDYVHSITARPAEWFREPGRRVEPRPLDAGRPFAVACRGLPVMKTRAVFAAGAPLQPWGAQIAGGISHAAAARAFQRTQRRFPALLGAGPPLIVRNRRGIGLRYAAQLGQPSRAAAARVCRRLTAVGAPCLVRRN